MSNPTKFYPEAFWAAHQIVLGQMQHSAQHADSILDELKRLYKGFVEIMDMPVAVPEQSFTDVLLTNAATSAAKITNEYQTTPAHPSKTFVNTMQALNGTTAQSVAQSVISDDPTQPVPAVPLSQSITEDEIICLEDGKSFKSLKRHLNAEHNMTPEQYIQKWGLPANYPMTASGYDTVKDILPALQSPGNPTEVPVEVPTQTPAETPTEPAITPPEEDPFDPDYENEQQEMEQVAVQAATPTSIFDTRPSPELKEEPDVESDVEPTAPSEPTPATTAPDEAQAETLDPGPAKPKSIFD